MDFAQARFNNVGQVLRNPEWRIKPHLHSFFEIIVILRGTMLLRSGGRTTECRSGDVMMYPAHVAHEEWADRNDPFESIFFGFTWPGFRKSQVIRTFDRAGRIRQMARWILDDRDSTETAMAHQRQSLLESLLAEFFRDRDREENRIVAATRQHVAKSMGTSFKLDELARNAGLSKFHFLRTYVEASGRTPMEDVRIMRVNYARDLLLSTNMAIKEIAVKSGLGNEFALSRMFRKVLNQTPRQIRRFSRG